MTAYGHPPLPLSVDVLNKKAPRDLTSLGRNQLPESCAATNDRNVETRKRRAETDAVLEMVAAVAGFIVYLTSSFKEVTCKQYYATAL